MAQRSLPATAPRSRAFLDADDIIELTTRQRPTAQAKMLRAMGIEHRVRSDGSIAVLRSHVEHAFGLGARRSAPSDRHVEPNWDALR